MTKMQSKHGRRLKITTLFLWIILSSIMFYVIYFKCYDLRNKEVAGDRCNAELVNVKHQLDSVLDYKGKMDNMLVELQQNCDLEKEALKEFANSFISMKQNFETCEVQAKEFEVESKNLKEKLDQISKQLTVCKKAPG